MMGVEAPETCWAKHKRQVINLWKTVASGRLFESYDDARTCQRQKQDPWIRMNFLLPVECNTFLAQVHRAFSLTLSQCSVVTPHTLCTSGAHTASYSRGLSGRGVKLTTRLPCSTEVKNEWSYMSAPPIRFDDVDRDFMYHRVITSPVVSFIYTMCCSNSQAFIAAVQCFG
jgi:hypothetical protein